MFHNQCRQHATELKEQLDNARGDASRCNSQLRNETSRANESDQALKQAEKENQELRCQISATQAREEALSSQVESLNRVLEGIQAPTAQSPEQDEREAEHRKMLHERRSRAAEACLGHAWDRPDKETSSNRAVVAQAILSLPLDAFDVTIEHAQDLGGGRTWMVNGKVIDSDKYTVMFEVEDPQGVLTKRYGIASEDLVALQRGLDQKLRDLHQGRESWDGEACVTLQTRPPKTERNNPHAHHRSQRGAPQR